MPFEACAQCLQPFARSGADDVTGIADILVDRDGGVDWLALVHPVDLVDDNADTERPMLAGGDELIDE